jgi:hypothetical protein
MTNLGKRSHLASALLLLGAVTVFAPGAGAHVVVRAPIAVKIAPPPGAVQRERAYADSVGTSADCNVYAADLYKRLAVAGITARVVNVFANSLNDYDAHTFVEVKVRNRWEIQDPTFDGWWSIDGHPASASDIQSALKQGRVGRVIWHGPAKRLAGYYVNPLLLFRIAQYIEPNSSGDLRVARTRTIPLDDLYYARPKAQGSVANVIVVSGGSDWTIGPYKLAEIPDGRWVSPIIFAAGLTLAGTGEGQETVLQVPTFPVGKIDARGSGSAQAPKVRLPQAATPARDPSGRPTFE